MLTIGRGKVHTKSSLPVLCVEVNFVYLQYIHFVLLVFLDSDHDGLRQTQLQDHYVFGHQFHSCFQLNHKATVLSISSKKNMSPGLLYLYTYASTSLASQFKLDVIITSYPANLFYLYVISSTCKPICRTLYIGGTTTSVHVLEQFPLILASINPIHVWCLSSEPGV